MTPTRQHLNSRIFSNEYNAANQLQLWNAYGGEALTARMRLDIIKGYQVVIPDTHLFDGRFLLTSGPRSLLAQLGATKEGSNAPFEIRCRRNNLSDSLAELLVIPGKDTLNAFRFKTLGDEDLILALASDLKTCPKAELDRFVRPSDNPAIGLANFLRSRITRFGGDTSRVAFLEESWREWLRFESELRVIRWATNYDALLLDRLLSVRPPDWLTNEVLRAAEEIQERVRRGETVKSVLDEFKRKSEFPTPADPNWRSEEWLVHWYELSRHQAIADQHDASYARTENEAQGDGILPALIDQREHDFELLLSHTAVLDLDLANRLGTLPADVFARFLTDSARELQAWRDSNDSRARDRALGKLASVLKEQASAHDSGIRTYAEYVGCVGAIAAPPLLFGGSLEYLATSVTALASVMVIGHRKREQNVRAGIRRRLIEYFVSS
jgi:hypothetical protein